MCAHFSVLPPWRTAGFSSIMAASMRNMTSLPWRSMKDKWCSSIPQVKTTHLLLNKHRREICLKFRSWYDPMSTVCTLFINVVVSFCGTFTCSCRWVVHSGESLRARRSERWQLAYCAHSLLQQGGSVCRHSCHISILTYAPVCVSLEVSDIPLVTCIVLLICRHVSFSVSRALWTELTAVCAGLCGLLPASFVHIHRTSLLIFFMFFHSPQPSTRYVSMSVCQSAHTLPLFLVFPPPYCQTVSQWRVSEWVSVFLFHYFPSHPQLDLSPLALMQIFLLSLTRV